MVLYMLMFVILIMFIPFASFYYEADETSLLDNKDSKPGQEATIYTTIVVLSVMITCISIYFTTDENIAKVPVKEYGISLADMTTTTYTAVSGGAVGTYVDSLSSRGPDIATSNGESTIAFPVTFDVYIVSLISWGGWFVFSVFAGVGLATVPFELILAYANKPRELDGAELHSREVELQLRTNEILDASVEMKKTRSTQAKSVKSASAVTDRVEVNRLTQLAFLLEQDVKELEACKAVNERYVSQYVNLFISLYLCDLYCYIISCDMSGVLESLDLLLSHPTLNSSIPHKLHTNIYLFLW